MFPLEKGRGRQLHRCGRRAGRTSSRDGENIVIECDDGDFDAFWREYLDLDRDYGKIKKAVSVNDVMCSAVEYGSGIRLLRQEFFETLISYIISQNNSIPNIKRVVERLCSAYGTGFDFGGETFYAFPKPEALAVLEPADFRALGAGFRDRYISGAARLVASGELSEAALCAMPTSEARKLLMEVKGVGNKVCDCVLLFSLGKYDLFPTDTWINKVMAERFGATSVKTAKSEGERLFGPYSGFAQQYLFYWRRELDRELGK